MKNKNLVWLVVAAMWSVAASGQDAWNLQRAVTYALTNNITVKQANLAYEQAAIDYRSNNAGLYPNAVFTNSWGMRFGRSENPTTGILENTKALSTTFSFTSSFNIFNFYSLRKAVAAYKYQQQSARMSEDLARNDISLRVANAYLLTLQSMEQVRVSQLQIALTTEQLNLTRKRVDAGALPELNVAEIEAQLATDSSNLVTAVSNKELQLLQLKAVLNLDAGVPFEVETPDLDKIPLEPLSEVQPEAVYNLALVNLPQIKIDDLNILAAENNRAATRGAMYPRLGGYINLASNFYSALQSAIAGVDPASERPTGLYARTPGSTVSIPVFSPVFTGKTVAKPFGQVWSGFGPQLNQNFGQNVGVSLSVPIFNGFQARSNWERAKLNLRTRQLQRDLDNQTLKQDIYTAYNNAVASLQKQVAGRKAVETAQRSYDLAKKRYDVNLLTSFELITNQNNLVTAQINYLLARYDYVFKMKVLEFYKGQGMKF